MIRQPRLQLIAAASSVLPRIGVKLNDEVQCGTGGSNRLRGALKNGDLVPFDIDEDNAGKNVSLSAKRVDRGTCHLNLCQAGTNKAWIRPSDATPSIDSH